MSLIEKIDSELKQAMVAKDEAKTLTLRSLKSAIKYAAIEKKADSLADPDLVSDIVLWLAGNESSLVTAAQIPADKGYLKV